MFSEFILRHGIRKTEKSDIANIKGKLAQCEVTPLSKGQKKDIDNFYLKIVGHRVPLYWHEYFYSRNGLFSEKYIPTSLYHKELIYRLNNHKFRHAYVDKAIYDIYFSDINRPKTIVKNINGYFYDEKNAISREEALERSRNLESAIVKPTLEGMWGEGVKVIATKDGQLDEHTTIDNLFDAYGSNFIVQG